VKSENNEVALDVVTGVVFQNDANLQDAAANLIGAIVERRNITGSVGFRGFEFGNDRSDIVDTFSKVALSLPLEPFGPTISKLTDDLIKMVIALIQNPPTTGPFKDVKLNIEDVDVDVVETNTLQADISATVEGIPIDALIDLPYVFTTANYNQTALVESTVSNIKFQQGKFTASTLLFFPENRNAAQSIFETLGNVLFHRKVPVQLSVGFERLGFGPSKENQIQTFSRAKPNVQIGDFIAQINDYVDKNRPIEIADIQASVQPEGIVADVTMTLPATPFLNLKASVLSAVTYQRDGVGPFLRLVDIPFPLIDVPRFRLILVPYPEDPSATAEALAAGLVNLLTFRDFASYARLGYIVMTGSKGHKFTAFDKAFFPASVLQFWSPLYLNLVPTWPWNPRNPFELIVPVAAKLSFANNGPFHLNIGKLDVSVRVGSKEIVSIESEGDVVFLNKHEGAAQTDPKKFKNMGTFVLKIPGNPFRIVEVLQQLLSGNGLNAIIDVKRNGKSVPYVPIIATQMLEKGALNALFPFIGVIISNIRLQVLGIGFDHPIFGRITQWIVNNLPGSRPQPQALIDSGNGTAVVRPLEGQNLIIISH
jgi:hypothetical protein